MITLTLTREEHTKLMLAINYSAQKQDSTIQKIYAKLETGKFVKQVASPIQAAFGLASERAASGAFFDMPKSQEAMIDIRSLLVKAVNEHAALVAVAEAVEFLDKHVTLNVHNIAVKRLREAQDNLAAVREGKAVQS